LKRFWNELENNSVKKIIKAKSPSRWRGDTGIFVVKKRELGVGCGGGDESANGVVMVEVARCVNLALPASVIAIMALNLTSFALTGHPEDFPGELVDDAEHNGEGNAAVLPLKIRVFTFGPLDEADYVLFEAPDFDPPLAKLWQSFLDFKANLLLLHAKSSMYNLR